MNSSDERATPRANLTLLLAAAAALGAVLVLARQVPYGVGLHWDSIVYVSVARNLLAGDGFLKYDGYSYVSQPPLYPLLLAVTSLDVLDPHDVAGPLNAALFGLTIFVIGQYLRRRLESRFLAVWAALIIALAWPLAGLAAYALTGAAFILLATLTLITTDEFLAKGRTSSLVWAGVWAALAWQTRYVGAALTAAVAVMLLWQRGARPAQRVWRAAGFSLLAGAPMALWLVRNRLVSDTFTGRPRGGGVLSLPATLSGAGEALRSWASFDLPLVERQAATPLGLLPAVALIAACAVLVRKRWRTQTSFDWLPCSVFGGFALTYFTVLVVSLALGATEHHVQPRFLTPLYVPLLVTAAFAFDRLLGFAPGRRRFWRRWKPGWRRRAPRTAAGAVTAVLCFWTAGQVEPNVRDIRQANSYGYGYASKSWARSATAEWIRRNPLAGSIFSNEPVAAYLHNDTSAEYGNLPRAEERLLPWLARSGTDTYVVWFDDVWVNRYFDYDRAVLLALPGLAPIAELADGAVFKSAPGDASEDGRIAHD